MTDDGKYACMHCDEVSVDEDASESHIATHNPRQLIAMGLASAYLTHHEFHQPTVAKLNKEYYRQMGTEIQKHFKG